MNEHVARDVVLVRAVETADTGRAIFTDDDRAYASRAAAELARWRAGANRRASSAELFIGERAELLARTLQQRAPGVALAARAFQWHAWLGVALPVVAFVLGALVEHIADRKHVNVIAFPLLAIVVWNVAVYVSLLLHMVSRLGGTRAPMRGPRRWLTAVRTRRLIDGGPQAASIEEFVAQWSKSVAPLMLARATRVLHLSAALFAIGAIAGLYVRGLVFEYRAGWESTFLEAPAVHALLSAFLSPAAHWIGIPFPSVEEIAAMRFTDGSAATGAANAAPWIHLYAVTVAAVVVVPRLALAALAEWQVKRRSRSFEFNADEPYFRRLAGSFISGPARMRVIPYSFTIDDVALQGLHAIAKALLGNDAVVTSEPSVGFGDETATTVSDDPTASLTLALFNLAATPENENHGTFLRTLRRAVGNDSRLAAIVDESGYRMRLGTQAGADGRLAERQNAWQYFCQTAGIDAAFVDLSKPDLVSIERDLERVLATPTASK
ncbi:MAG: DUF2868 domain-containing protein [Burkholderiaceae bacterium]